MKRVLYFLSLVILGLLWSVPVQAENSYVEDQANVLSSETKEEIYQYNQNYKDLELRPQLAVVTLEELPEGQSIETYANEKFNELGIGDEARDFGVLYVIAVNNRKQRIEVGYGLEEMIPDALAMDLMTEKAKDYFRAENYDKGVSIVAANINEVLQGNKKAEDFKPGLFTRLFSGLSFWEIITERVGPALLVLAFVYAFIEPPIVKLFIYRKAKKAFAVDLKNRVKEADPKYQNYSIRKMIHCNEPPVAEAKAMVKKRYGKRKRNKPTYYDFTFAFGNLTLWGLLWKKKRAIQNYSVYYHHRETWTSSSSSDSSSSGGDSWGGGSSGGGGASSDW